MKRTHPTRIWLLTIASIVCLFASATSAEVIIDWVTVGDPGNAGDPNAPGFGDVAYEYQIGKFEVTTAQYTEFLNAVAATDTNGLYHTSMAGPSFELINRTGSSGSFSYSVFAGRDDWPVYFVSFWSATRFANWLHNGQPAGLQDITTTEDGAYMLTPAAITANTVTRNPWAKVVVPSRDEWHKAAYYDTASMSYFDYPAGSDTQTTCALPGG